MKKFIVLLTLVVGFSSVFAATDAVSDKPVQEKKEQTTVHKWYDSAKQKAEEKWPEVKKQSKEAWEKTKGKTKEWYKDVKDKFKKDKKPEAKN